MNNRREIKLRAWYEPDFNTPDGPLMFVMGLGPDSDIGFVHGEGKDRFFYPLFVPFEDPEWIVEEFTGLSDRKGKEIYEGDIVRLAGYGNYTCVFPFLSLYDAAFERDIGDILGNIHQNPELAE